ncbi:MAG TPA: cytochrome c [Aurantimonas sp.]|jgi:cytochrome c556|nr:cytochrome c [Aurantimonas sp.]
MQARSFTVALVIAAIGTAFAAPPAGAQNLEAIKQRQELMKENGRSAKAASEMIKGEAAFDPATAAAIFVEMHDVAVEFGDLFPEDSKVGEETEAAPAIWERPEEFQAALAQFRDDTEAAMDAAPQDIATFRQAFGRVAENCKGCHEEFRIDKD